MTDISRDEIHRIVLNGHPMFNAGFEWLLGPTDDLVAVASGQTAADALRHIDEHRPDVVVIDAGRRGDEVVGTITERAPDTRLLLMTEMESASPMLSDASQPFGCLVKPSSPAEILAAIRAVACGATVFGAGVFAMIRAQIGTRGRSVFPALTDREHEVLALLADGLGYADVARRLRVATKTVRNHMSNILMKLRVSRRGEAVDLARRFGLGSVTSHHRPAADSSPAAAEHTPPPSRSLPSTSTAPEPETTRSTTPRPAAARSVATRR